MLACISKLTWEQLKNFQLKKDEAESYAIDCVFSDYDNNCVYETWFKYIGSEIRVEYRPEKGM